MLVKNLNLNNKNHDPISPYASVDYCLNERVAQGTARIIKGDENITKKLIDELQNKTNSKNKVEFGVLSFKEKVNDLTEQDKLDIIDSFEKMFVGTYMQERLHFLWVEHSDKDERLELNFIVPQIDLQTREFSDLYYYKSSQKDGDIKDKHTDQYYKTLWAEAINLAYNLASPIDPNLQKGYIAHKVFFNKKKAKLNKKIVETLIRILDEKVKSGEIATRQELINHVNKNNPGFNIQVNKNSISLQSLVLNKNGKYTTLARINRDYCKKDYFLDLEKSKRERNKKLQDYEIIRKDGREKELEIKIIIIEERIKRLNKFWIKKNKIAQIEQEIKEMERKNELNTLIEIVKRNAKIIDEYYKTEKDNREYFEQRFREIQANEQAIRDREQELEERERDIYVKNTKYFQRMQNFKREGEAIEKKNNNFRNREETNRKEKSAKHKRARQIIEVSNKFERRKQRIENVKNELRDIERKIKYATNRLNKFKEDREFARDFARICGDIEGANNEISELVWEKIYNLTKDFIDKIVNRELGEYLANNQFDLVQNGYWADNALDYIYKKLENTICKCKELIKKEPAKYEPIYKKPQSDKNNKRVNILFKP